jgi:hypothetical protein
MKASLLSAPGLLFVAVIPSNVTNRAAIALLATLLWVSCRGPAPQVTVSGRDQVRLAGKYRFSTADLNINLDIRPDGTYWASMDAWATITEEHGVWRLERDNIVLKPQSEGQRLPIRELEPFRDNGADMLRIIEPDSAIGRAIVFRRE